MSNPTETIGTFTAGSSGYSVWLSSVGGVTVMREETEEDARKRLWAEARALAEEAKAELQAAGQ